MELGFNFQSEIVISNLSKKQIDSIMKSISHEGNVSSSRCVCKSSSNASSITLSFKSDDSVSLRASINSYLRIISSIEQIETNINSIKE